MTDGLHNASILKCPSCGSPMGVPDLQGIVQCSYCGTKIVLPPTEATKERKNLTRYKELCLVERQAKNWNNLLKYASEILEIDPNDLDAWIDKALATGSLSNYLVPRLDEALGYLQKASELSPDDSRISKIRSESQDVQFNQYSWHALEVNQSAIKMIRLGSAGRQHAIEWTLEAMSYFILAHKIKPDDSANLQNIKTVSENGKLIGIQWSQEVQSILLKFEKSKVRQIAAEQQAKVQQTSIKRLSLLHEKLNQRRAELEKLNQKKRGFFVNMEIEDVQNEIKKIMLEINKLESSTK